MDVPEKLVYLLRLLAAPLGVAFLSWVAVAVLFNTGGCNVHTAGLVGTCSTPIGIDVPASFNADQAGAVVGAILGVLAGGIAALVGGD